MTDTTRTVLVAVLLALAVLTGAALASPATTTTDEQTNETASVSVSDQQFDGESVTIDSATLPDGGFAVVHDEGGERIGHTEYLEAGDNENLTVSLNRTVENSQVLVVGLYRNNGSEAYNASEDTVAYETADDENVTDVSYVYFEERGSDTTTEERSTETDEERSTELGETTTDSAMSDDSEETTTESSGGMPGFTPMTAVVALVAAALVGWRRS